MREERVPQGGNLTIRDILGHRPFKNKLASEWIEDIFGRLQEKTDLSLPNLDGGLTVSIVSPDVSRVALSGQKVLPKATVGFNAGFISGELRMLSVFAFLEDRFIWMTEGASRRENFYQVFFESKDTPSC